jgi:hypothetical protein
MRYTLSSEQRAERRKATAAMTKCACGNVARFGETQCGRCAAAAADTALDIAKRVQHFHYLRRRIGDLIPTDPDFGTDLRAVLFDIVDAIEGRLT